MTTSTLTALLRLTRLNRPVGSLLLLWPTLWALWIANDGLPSVKLLLVFIGGVVLTRSAGCALNDYADRDLDAQVSRTRDRPLATQALKPAAALWTFGVLSLAAFGLVLLLDWQTILLSGVALALMALYPWMKRHTHLPQLVLGAAFSWSIPMAFSASGAPLSSVCWLLYLANLLWTIAYDTQYAMADRADDLKAGIKSTAILFGNADTLIIGLLDGLTLISLLLLGWQLGFNLFFYGALALALLLFGYQQRLLAPRLPELCIQAFRHNNWVGLLLFIGIALQYPWPATR